MIHGIECLGVQRSYPNSVVDIGIKVSHTVICRPFYLYNKSNPFSFPNTAQQGQDNVQLINDHTSLKHPYHFAHIFDLLNLSPCYKHSRGPQGRGTPLRNHADFYPFTHSNIERKIRGFTQYCTYWIENGSFHEMTQVKFSF